MKIFLYVTTVIVLFLSAPAPAPASGSVATSAAVAPNPADFVQGVDNPYYPLTPGSRWVYEATLADGSTEHIEVEVLQETRDVMGITAIVVRDTVTVDEQMVEDTHDWYAQDSVGNVWYLGEEVDNYENGVLVDHAGSWEWGVDGALPGNHHVG